MGADIMVVQPRTWAESDPISVAVTSIHRMAEGDRGDFDPLYAAQAVDQENRIQPPSSRVTGPAGFYATALWLRAAFAGLHYDIHHAVADDDLVAVNSTMNGRHTAPGRCTVPMARWTASFRRLERASV